MSTKTTFKVSLFSWFHRIESEFPGPNTDPVFGSNVWSEYRDFQTFFSEEPYKFEYIWDTRKLTKNCPIISWDMYIDYLRVEQKRHPQEQPEIYIDEVMAIQTDSGLGKALMK